MTTAEFLADLRRAGVELRLAADRLLYDAPAGAMTPELRAALAGRKAELVAFLGGPGPATAGAPLSFAQESLWFLHQLYPGDTSASEQFAIRIEGPLDTAALDLAWHALLERHSILRTCFPERDGAVRQVAGPPGRATIPVTELLENPDERLLAAAEEELRVPFDLARGPLLRPRLFRSAPDRHVLLVTAEHLVADGLSVAVIRADLAALYGGFMPGAPPAQLAPVARYGDFARRQRSGSGDPDAELAYWRGALDQLPARALEALPRPTGAPEHRDSRRVPLVLPADLAARVRRLGRECGATPFMVLLAAFRALLARLTQQDDIVIGTPMTVRDSAETRGMVGCFVNPVALRTPTAGELTLRGLVGRERATVLGALQHREVPFSRVVAAVGPARRVGEHPLFQVLFSFEAGTGGSVQAGGASFQVEAVPAARASFFDLECALRDDGDAQPMQGHFAFATARIEACIGNELPRHFLVLLAAALERPDTPLARLDLLDADERARVLTAFNGTRTTYPDEQTLHGLFLQQAARTPEATALRPAVGTWTYRELAERSAALAARLVARGVVPGATVGLAVGRSPELVAALLAVLRAGGVAVPLDPSSPWHGCASSSGMPAWYS